MAKTTKPAGKGKAMTKTAIYAALAERAGIDKKEVAALFEGLSELIKKQLKKDGDTFTIPGMLRLRLRRQKAVKGGKEVKDPFNPGKMRITKDKPARNVIRARPLKGLNELVQ